MIRARVAAATRCCMDYTGMGIGMGDMLAREFGEYKPEAHKFGRVELCTFSASFKREIFPKLREAMEGAACVSPRMPPCAPTSLPCRRYAAGGSSAMRHRARRMGTLTAARQRRSVYERAPVWAMYRCRVG